MSRNYFKRGISYLKRNGIRESFYKAAERISRDREESSYDLIAKNSVPDEQTLKIQREKKFENPYKFSILVPLYETDYKMLSEMLVSVGEQTYTNWELILADASSDDSRRNTVRDFCEDYYLQCSDSFGSIRQKVKYIYLNQNKGIAGNTNEALSNAEGDYVVLLDHDDVLSHTALFDIMWNISEREITRENGQSNLKKIMAVYTDEDKVNSELTKYFDVHRKPDFDPILLCTNNYICHLFAVDSNIARSVGGFREEYDGAQDHDFILRCLEGLKEDQIIHIPKVLYHWRSTKSSTSENPSAKLYAYRAGKAAVEDYLVRNKIKAEVIDTAHLGFYRIVYDKLHLPVVAISREKFDEMSEEQLSEFSQDFMIIVSDRLKPLNPLYIETMMSCMQHDFVGAVTGKILTGSGKIESAGFDIENGESVPRFKGLNGHFSGYLHRANLQMLVGDFSRDLVLLRKEAVVSYKPEIVLRDGYKIYYEPEAGFKRKKI